MMTTPPKLEILVAVSKYVRTNLRKLNDHMPFRHKVEAGKRYPL